MNTTAIRRAAALMLVVTLGWMKPLTAGEQKTFTGTYDWLNGGSDRLVANFKADGDGGWDVQFQFDFSGDDYTWTGKAEGDLEDGGELTGTASWDRNGREWVFTATLVGDVIKGEHAEIRNGEPKSSGTFQLSR